MEATGYWPAELALDAGIIYLVKNSKNPWEIFFLIIALCIHVPRQIRERPVIKETSRTKSFVFLLSIPVLFSLGVYFMGLSKWPVPFFIALVIGVAYVILTNQFVKESGMKFNLYEPWIAIPQLFISGTFSWIAFRAKNPISILWVADFVYHVLQLPLLRVQDLM
jgi:hypothetical protein